MTDDIIKVWLAYDKGTGLLTWLKGRGPKAKRGAVAGTMDKEGYRVVMLFGKLYKAHRIAWIYTYGCWPAAEIDHINGVRADNRIVNLRDVSRTINAQNMHGPRRVNRTGMLGVSVGWREGVFTSEIKRGGVRHKLGVFSTAQEAHQAYLTAKARLDVSHLAEAMDE